MIVSGNPYSSSDAPADDGNRRDLLELARRFAEYRAHRPTILSMIRRWRALPLFVVTGVVTVPLLGWLVEASDFDFIRHAPLAIGAMLVGALLRDFGNICRFVRSWPAWQEILNWEKIDELNG